MSSLPPVIEQRSMHACAYRHGRLVCARVEITAIRDHRVGLAPRERRYLTARFRDGLDPELRADLVALVRRRGAAGNRLAERLEPIELVAEHRARLIGRLQPPRLRWGELGQVEFRVRELRTADPG